MVAKKKEKRTLKSTVVFDPISKRFIQKGHIVHGEKVLQYLEAYCEYCSKKYPKKRKDQRFCNDTCRMKWWVRQHHNGEDPNYGVGVCPIDEVVFTKTRPWSKYCSIDCRLEGIKRITANNRRQRIAELALQSV